MKKKRKSVEMIQKNWVVKEALFFFPISELDRRHLLSSIREKDGHVKYSLVEY